MWRVTNGGRDPQGVSIAPGQDQASRDPSCHVSRGREIHQLGWGCAAGSGVSMSQGSERQQEVERESREKSRSGPYTQTGDEVLTSAVTTRVGLHMG